MMLMRARPRTFIIIGLSFFFTIWFVHNLSSRRQESLINLNRLQHVGECLLREAGKEIVRIRRENTNEDAKFEMKHKADASVVTRADLRSHTIIVHTLESLFPGLTINSEENQGDLSDEELRLYRSRCDTYVNNDGMDLLASLSDVNVWVDPLDATQEYSENLVDYVTVMFCIVKRNKPRAGMIFFFNFLVQFYFEKSSCLVGVYSVCAYFILLVHIFKEIHAHI